MSNEGSGMLPLHVITNQKSKLSNRCEEYWSNPWYVLSPLKAALVSLFLSHFFPSLFTFNVEEAASCRRDRLPRNTSSKPKLDHPNLAKAARQHPWGYALYMPLEGRWISKKNTNEVRGVNVGRWEAEWDWSACSEIAHWATIGS
jgi:hypothetical protein